MKDFEVEKAVLLARLLSRLYLDIPDVPLLSQIFKLDLSEIWPFPQISWPLMDNSLAKVSADELEIVQQALREEFMTLFIGPGMPQVPLWGSTYLDSENLLMAQSTYELETFLAHSGLASRLRAREPLDHLALLLSALAHFLARLQGGTAKDWQTLLILLEKHLLTWTPRCLELQAQRAQSSFYKNLGLLTEAFLNGLASASGACPQKEELFY